MWLAILFGLAVRLGLAPWTEQRFDMYVWRLTGAYIYIYHLNPFWPWIGTPSIFPPILNFSYPPLWLLVIIVVYPLWLLNSGFAFPRNVSQLWQIGVQTGNVYESYRSFLPVSLPLLDFTLKLPIIACDIVTALALYRGLAGQREVQSAVTWLWLFNPYVILISAVWGQFDSIPTMFSLLAILFSIRGKPTLSGFLLALGCLTKVFPVVYLPLVTLYHWKKTGTEAGKLIVGFLATCACFIPVYFVLGNGIPSIYLSLASWPSPDWFGRNAFGGLTWLRLVDNSLWHGNFPIFLTLLTPLYIIILFGFRRMKFNDQGLLLTALGVTFALYLTYTIVNEQYVLWFLPFAIVLLPRNRTLRLGVITMSGVAFVYAFLHNLRYDMFYFFTPILDSVLTPLRNGWISHWWQNFEAGPVSAGLMVVLSLFFSLITVACLTSLLLRHVFHPTPDSRTSTRTLVPGNMPDDRPQHATHLSTFATTAPSSKAPDCRYRSNEVQMLVLFYAPKESTLPSDGLASTLEYFEPNEWVLPSLLPLLNTKTDRPRIIPTMIVAHENPVIGVEIGFEAEVDIVLPTVEPLDVA
jgi:hypothetical protein